MNKWKIAFSAFCKAWKNPQEGREFLEEKKAGTETNEHLRLLSLLQREGRLIDFLKEDITPFTDAQIGAAVRKIHGECSKSLEEFVTLRPLMNEAEGSCVTLPQGYDAQAIKVVGKVSGSPPFQGIVRHKGWRAHKLSLPKQVEKADASIVYPAEVEIK